MGRGVSPIIATVLLLIMTVSLTTIFYKFVKNAFEQSKKSSNVYVNYIKNLGDLNIVSSMWYDYKNGLVVEFTLDEGSGLEVYYKDLVGNLLDVPCYYKKRTYGGHYYEFYRYGCGDLLNIIPNWKYSKNYCSNRSGYLTVISDSSENSFIASTVNWDLWIGYYQDPDNLSDNYGWPEGCPGNEPAGCWKWGRSGNINI